ncbi:MAG: hypothetical protein ACM3SP_22325 [Chloroflexota bacterium]
MPHFIGVGDIDAPVRLSADSIDIRVVSTGVLERFTHLPLYDPASVCLRRRTERVLASPPMARDTIGRIITTISGFLARRIFGKKLRIITHMHGGDEKVASGAHRRHDGTTPATWDDFRPRFDGPEDAKTVKFFGRNGFGGAGTAPVHMPGVLSRQSRA